MNSRERFHAVMNFEPFDRLPLVEWASWWNLTVDRWHDDGLPAEVADRYDLYRYFGLEQYRQAWFRPLIPPAPYHGGAVIRDMDDYLAIRDALYPEPPVEDDLWLPWAADQQRGDAVLWITLQGYFWYPRTLFGIEEHFYAFYDHPELMHLINADLTAWNLRIIDKLTRICTPDYMTFAEDMSYNHGAMLSKELFDEFLAPYYRQIIPVLKGHGVLPIVDSDGDVTELAYWLEEVGVEGILPLERQAGVDIARLRAEHPRMRFIGHFDKMTMTRGEAAMRAEFERLLPVARQGGFIISVDHQTPPGVSLEEYRIYLRLFDEYSRKAAGE